LSTKRRANTISKNLSLAKNLRSLHIKSGEFKRGAAPLRIPLFPLPPGGRAGRHPMRIYSHWDMGRGIGKSEGINISKCERRKLKGFDNTVPAAARSLNAQA
jgi:hypothetical protein